MNLFQRYLVEEFAEDYQEGRISRRKALRLILGVTGSLVLTNSILAACTPAGTENQGTALATEDGVIPTTGAPAATEAPTMAAPTMASSATNAATPAASATGASTATAAATAAGTPSAAATSGTPSAITPAIGTVSPDDPQLTGGAIEFPGEGATLKGYQAIPKGNGPFPLILVCHENRGLTAHIEDVTRRLAKAGYAALAVDLLSRQGGTAKFAADDVPGALGNTPPEQFVTDFRSGWTYLKGQPFAAGDKVGMVGFCFGGGVTWQVAVNMPELLAAVPFYGPPPDVADLPKINAAVLAIYAGKDTRITSSAPAIEEAMKANNKVFEKEIYPDVDHAFHNDTGTRYAPEAAKAAWARTLAWFEKYVRG